MTKRDFNVWFSQDGNGGRSCRRRDFPAVDLPREREGGNGGECGKKKGKKEVIHKTRA